MELRAVHPARRAAAVEWYTLNAVAERATAAELLASHERGKLTDAAARADAAAFARREAERVALRDAPNPASAERAAEVGRAPTSAAQGGPTERSVLLAMAANLRERAQLYPGSWGTLSGAGLARHRLLAVAGDLDELAHDLDDEPAVSLSAAGVRP